VNEALVTVGVAAVSITAAYVLGYFLGRAVGREQGAVDAWRRRAAIERRSSR
jgi:hypothetical protein